MACYLKATYKLLALIVIIASALPAHADSNKDDFSGLFEYFSKEQQEARNKGIVLEQTEGRRRGSNSTLSLFGKDDNTQPDIFSHNNFSGRDFRKEPTNILNLRVDF